MTKKLTQHGNSLALVIDKPILDLLRIDADTPLEITTDGQKLLVEPQRDPARQKKFRASLEKMSKRYEKTMHRLAE
jgi:antitoxin MazE